MVAYLQCLPFPIDLLTLVVAYSNEEIITLEELMVVLKTNDYVVLPCLSRKARQLLYTKLSGCFYKSVFHTGWAPSTDRGMTLFKCSRCNKYAPDDDEGYDSDYDWFKCRCGRRTRMLMFRDERSGLWGKSNCDCDTDEMWCYCVYAQEKRMPCKNAIMVSLSRVDKRRSGGKFVGKTFHFV